MNRAITASLAFSLIAASGLAMSLPAEAHHHHCWRYYQANNVMPGYSNPYMSSYAGNPYMTSAVSPYAASPYMAQTMSPYATSPYMTNPYMANSYMNPGLLQRMRMGLGL